MSISVAIYVRLSDEDRNKKYKGDESESIQNQKSLLKDFCRERNWEIYDIYNDEDYSGTDSSRPEFNRMIADCESGRVNLVLCKHQDRFARDNEVVNHYIHDKFLEWGVRFKSVIDHIDTDDENTKKQSQILALTSEWYCEDTSKKIKSVLQHKREQGQFTGSFAPYGYAVDPKNKNHLVIDPVAAENVRLIFDLYAQGNGYRAIVIELNSRGIPSPTLYKQMCGSKFYNANVQDSHSKGLWTHSTIFTMIRNEIYTGTLVQGKSHNVSYKNHKKKRVNESEWIRVPNTHDAIIDPLTWQKVQERLQGRVRVDTITQTLSPLAGKVKCAVCGKPMKRNVYYNKKRTIQYYGLQCGTYKIGAMNCANTKSISGMQLEAFLVQQINTHIRQFCYTNKLTLLDKHQEKIDTLTGTINLYKEQIADKENKVTKMYEDYLDGTISAEQYKIISKKFTDTIAELNAKCENIQGQIAHIESIKSEEADKKAIINKYLYVDKLTREIVDDFIDTVYIGEYEAGKDRKITIDWKI
ncbi:MAG: recombinase family protein [Oscillospiraceae bacterium]